MDNLRAGGWGADRLKGESGLANRRGDEASVPHCLGYFRIVVQCRLIDRDTMRPNNKALSPRPLCINLSARNDI